MTVATADALHEAGEAHTRRAQTSHRRAIMFTISRHLRPACGNPALVSRMVVQHRRAMALRYCRNGSCPGRMMECISRSVS